MLWKTFGVSGPFVCVQTVCCYCDKRDHYLCVKLQLCTEQPGVYTHQLSIPVMEVALNTDQEEVSPISVDLFSPTLQKGKLTHPEFPNFNKRTVVSHAVLQNLQR